MTDPDILRKNCVQIISTLRNQAYICDYLLQHRVLSDDNREEILCGSTNSARNRILVDFVRCRFTSGFKHFCDALQHTHQYRLLEKLDPQRPTKQTDDNCPVCLSAHANIVFSHCGHGTCEDCSTELAYCPLCRGKIHTKLRVFL